MVLNENENNRFENEARTKMENLLHFYKLCKIFVHAQYNHVYDTTIN